MRFHMTWEGQARAVATAADVETTLDEIDALARAARFPLVVTVMPPGGEDLAYFDEDAPDFLQVGLGHPEVAFVNWTGFQGGYAVEPGRPPGPKGVRFSFEGQPVHPEPEELRVTPRAARQAVREFVTTDRRPTCVSWPAAGEGTTS